MELDTAKQQVISPNTPTQPMVNSPVSNQKSFAPAILGVIVLLIVVAGGAYYLGSKQAKPESKITNESMNKQVSPPINSGISQQPTVTSNHNEFSKATIKGKMLLRSGKDILVADLDGNNSMKLISSTYEIGIAGWSNDGSIIYYSELSGTTGKVYRKDLSNGIVSQLFTFDNKDKNVEFFTSNVSVSHDGKYAIYSHSNGNISLYDIQNQTTKDLLTQKSCLSYDSKPNSIFSLVRQVYAGMMNSCYGYFFPYWSPDDKRVVIRKIFYEGSTQIVINPFDNMPQEKDLQAGGGTPDWSADSKKVVIPGLGYGVGSLYLVYSLDDPVNKDLLLNTELKDVGVTSGVISDDGKIAFTYTKGNVAGISLYSLSDNSTRNLTSENNSNYYVQVWLPDNKTIIFGDQNNLWSLDTISLRKTNLPVSGNIIGIVK